MAHKLKDAKTRRLNEMHLLMRHRERPSASGNSDYSSRVSAVTEPKSCYICAHIAEAWLNLRRVMQPGGENDAERS